MKIIKKVDVSLEETSISNLLIDKYVPSMTGLEVKLYLFLLRYTSSNQTEPFLVDEESLVKKCGCDISEINKTLGRLETLKLIRRDERLDRIEIIDPKLIYIEYIESRFESKISGSFEDTSDRNETLNVQNQLIQGISTEFFNGMISAKWVSQIADILENYNFEQQVVYSLFKECASRNALNIPYVKKVAIDWQRRGVRTLQDLEQVMQSFRDSKNIAYKVGKALNKNLTEFDIQKINTWIEELNYEYDVIELALEKTTAIQQPNLNYITTILRNWRKHNLNTTEEVKAFLKQEKSVPSLVAKSLNRTLTEFDKDEIDKWIKEFNYNYDIIEIALEKTKNIQSPNLGYISKILSGWHEKGLKTKEDILRYDEEQTRIRKLEADRQLKQIKAKSYHESKQINHTFNSVKNFTEKNNNIHDEIE